ncbi:MULTISPECIES: hypothetical protein [Bacillus]|jgi:hypothetical protein|uniref:Uncharacterized protein n=2 Tax=Bacillus TaxID=1386 RepID=A0A0T6BVK1_9BACI|nr:MULTISPECIES: hypothetical protein [Bacillus]AMR10698.1 hypothetical protein AB684_11075 [Bacillus licheniformis]ASB89258.1 hypothetical protein S101395_02751 [Bacillus sonorensis]EFV73044.1 hypothetical protein HMPREF1012_00966 [Bacillus sp. BT1B_CT2]EQM25399.1 hypothetical protein N399_24435 [Bacillus licheniformis CG-B52]KJH58777.1 hypothetical protein UF14_10265 [Bacillus licheniformis]
MSNGFKEFDRKLKKMQQKASELEKGQELQLNELFTDSFMKKNTKFSSLDEMLDKSPFTIETQQDFESIPDDLWDDFVRENSKFFNWEEMQQEAANIYVAKQLGF